MKNNVELLGLSWFEYPNASVSKTIDLVDNFKAIIIVRMDTYKNHDIPVVLVKIFKDNTCDDSCVLVKQLSDTRSAIKFINIGEFKNE